MANIKTFKELKVWGKAHCLVLEIYKLTKKFPAEERYALTQQLQRTAVSIASNIVEGFHRLSVKDSLRFYNIANASLEEAKYQLLIARDLNYISDGSYKQIILLCEEVGRMLNYWIQSQIKNAKLK